MNTGPIRIEIHINITDHDASAIDLLAANTGVSKSRLKQAMIKGAVWLTRGKKTQRVRRAKKTFLPGDTLHLYYDEQVLAREPSPAELIADEGGYSVWFKPCGMLSQGSKWGDHCTVNRWTEQHLQPQRPAFVVHRLDRAATGLVIIAHEKKIAAKLSQLFKDRKIEKRYRVIVHGHFPEHEQRLDSQVDGKTAISLAQRLDYDKQQDISLLDVTIETGRKHQIRLQLSEAGFPVVGDRLYGNNERDKVQNRDLQLTAVELRFNNPLDHTETCYLLRDELRPAL